MAGTREGLRERKKRLTREAITGVARRLFAERGFAAVTVAEIAAAADVSEKTVFNHFATKEAVLVGTGDPWLAQAAAGVAERVAGVAVLDVVRAATASLLDAVVAGEVEDALVVPRIVRATPGLAERLGAGTDREAAALAAAIGGDALLAEVVARSLTGAHRAIAREAFDGLLDGEEPRALAARMRRRATKAYDLLSAGLGEYGRKDDRAVQ
jgi:AcrR family transcriptional regulator